MPENNSVVASVVSNRHTYCICERICCHGYLFQFPDFYINGSSLLHLHNPDFAKLARVKVNHYMRCTVAHYLFKIPQERARLTQSIYSCTS